MALSQKTPAYAARNEIKDDAIRRALDDIASRQQAGFRQVNATVEGVTPAPPAINSLTVTAADGIFDVRVVDNGDVHRGIVYFLEYSLTPNFSRPTQIALGPARNWRGNLGNQTFYWRAYSQYPTSSPSPEVYFGTSAKPTAVAGGGAAAGPSPQSSAGSGTAPSDGFTGGSGFGHTPSRTGNRTSAHQVLRA